jgi:hypothetical protein
MKTPQPPRLLYIGRPGPLASWIIVPREDEPHARAAGWELAAYSYVRNTHAAPRREAVTPAGETGS